MNTKPKPVALFDIDHTIFKENSFLGLTKYLHQVKVLNDDTWGQIEAEKKRYFAGETTYTQAAKLVLAIFAQGLVGQNYTEILFQAVAFFNDQKTNFYPYFTDILPKLKKTHRVYLVSTNAQFIAQAVNSLFDLDGFISTEFELKNGIFTGRMASTLADGKQIAEKLLLPSALNSIAMGDSENDVSMLEKVQFPLCINPSEELLSVANNRGWRVVTDQTAKDAILDILNQIP